MIIGQLGRRDAPYIYVDVSEEERYSATLDKHFRHVVLKIGYSYNGPTEIGGLIVSPEYRKKPERLGLLISYVRFLYIKMHRELVQATSCSPSSCRRSSRTGRRTCGTRVGRKFTDMTYAEADRLSKKNKEFIKGLFPEGAIYATLLPQNAQDVIGKVGAQTRGRGEDAAAHRLQLRLARRSRSTAGRTSRRRRTTWRWCARAHEAARHEDVCRGARRPKTRALVAVERSRAAVLPRRSRAVEDRTAKAAASGPSRRLRRCQAGDPVWILPLESLPPEGPERRAASRQAAKRAVFGEGDARDGCLRPSPDVASRASCL